jgi:glucokinase
MLTNLYAEPLRTVKRPVAASDLSPERGCQILAGAVSELVMGIEPGCIVGMGVAVPAVANPTSGVVVSSVVLPWQNVPLGDYLRQALSFPTLVFSRGSAATWGERWYGAGREIENLLYVRVGNGVVAGLVIEGQPYWGVHFGAGELGHVTVQPDGELCRCGNRGCLTTVATTEALVSRVRQLLREDMSEPLWEQLDHHIERLDFATLVAAAIGGNRAAKQGLAEVARWLALAISSAIHLVDLQMVIVGGPMIEAGEMLFAPLRAELAQRTLPTHFRYVQIVPSLLGADAPSIGAASLVLHQLVSAERMTPLQPGVIAAVR